MKAGCKMGEIAEAMISGELCELCGVYIGPAVGHPRNCGCDFHNRNYERYKSEKIKTKKVKCELCDRMVKPAGMHQHLKDRHGL